MLAADAELQFGPGLATELHAGVEAELRQRLRELAQWLQKQPAEANRKEAAALIQAYLSKPQSVTLRRLPAVPPGATSFRE